VSEKWRQNSNSLSLNSHERASQLAATCKKFDRLRANGSKIYWNGHQICKDDKSLFLNTLFFIIITIYFPPVRYRYRNALFRGIPSPDQINTCTPPPSSLRIHLGGDSPLSKWRVHLLKGLVQTAVSVHLQRFGE
jgi:hypothetical protein